MQQAWVNTGHKKSPSPLIQETAKHSAVQMLLNALPPFPVPEAWSSVDYPEDSYRPPGAQDPLQSISG